MAVKSGEKRGKYKKRVDAVLPSYVNMAHRLYGEQESAEWECMKCHSNSLLPTEYGCSMCQPFVLGAKLTGRKYK